MSNDRCSTVGSKLDQWQSRFADRREDRCLSDTRRGGGGASFLAGERVGRVPAARGRAVALRVEPPSKAQRLAPDGRPSLTRTRRHPPRSLARRVSPDCGLRALPGRSRTQRSRLRLHRDAEQPGQAGVAGGVFAMWVWTMGLGVSPLRGAGLLRCASSRCQRPSVSPLTGGHPSRNTVRPALAAGMTTAALSRARGSRAWVPSRCA